MCYFPLPKRRCEKEVRANADALQSTWGDTAELKTAAPFHHNRLCILMYIFRPVTPENAHTFPGLRDFAAMARESALMILRFGVESQIWLPHSMTGQYLV